MVWWRRVLAGLLVVYRGCMVGLRVLRLLIWFWGVSKVFGFWLIWVAKAWSVVLVSLFQLDVNIGSDFNTLPAWVVGLVVGALVVVGRWGLRVVILSIRWLVVGFWSIVGFWFVVWVWFI